MALHDTDELTCPRCGEVLEGDFGTVTPSMGGDGAEEMEIRTPIDRVYSAARSRHRECAPRGDRRRDIRRRPSRRRRHRWVTTASSIVTGSSIRTLASASRVAKEAGIPTRFVVQLERRVDNEWRQVVRFDHDPENPMGHDITEECLHMDVYRNGEKTRVKDDFHL